MARPCLRELYQFVISLCEISSVATFPSLGGDVFDQHFRRHVVAGREIKFRTEPIENLSCNLAAHIHGKLVTAQQESFDQLQIFRSDARQAGARETGPVGFAFTVDPVDRLFPRPNRFTDDDGPGNIIAQPAGVPVQQSADDAYGINAGNAVDDAQQIACDRIHGVDGPAGFFDDAQAHKALTGCLAVPDGLKECKVGKNNEEIKQCQDCGGPRGCWRRARGLRPEQHRQQDARHRDHRNLDERIESEGQKTAANAGNRQLERNHFRRVDGKMIVQRAISVVHPGWIQKRKPGWERLASLVERCGSRRRQKISYHDLRELSLLYRQAAADYASLREDEESELLAGYLNQLLARAHGALYGSRKAEANRVLKFYQEVFPGIFRETLNYTLLALIIFLVSALTGFLLTLSDPAFQRFFLGARMSDTIDRRKMWTTSIVTIKPLASSAIMTNNLSVSFSTFALGITAGLGTAWMLALNGMLLGVVTAACWQAGMLSQLAAFVTPHGVLELPSIFMAGGAGLLLARGLLFPGLLPRREALVFYGRKGVQLALGIIPLLFAAGIIEAFVSPSAVPAAAKFALGAVLGCLLAVYLSRGWHRLPKREPGGKP